MIAIDTNVLLRYLLNDDPKQSKKASAVIQSSQKVLITDVVLVETIWTLKGKKYNQGKDSIVKVISALFEEPNLCFEDGQSVWRALVDFKNAIAIKAGTKQKMADFPDALIVNKAQFASNNLGEELEGVYTFDVAAQALPGTKVP
ncbi:MAG: type II toxin-antitoxin system VapC family toxin [Candidatus Scalindua sp.]|jgi:predicted nucleic-acid-binding protein|nr:type II toxin-antitoxin system VapC family toxin [Candidatus Scalindua sp.]